ncbi:GNAT family N-acetyltransferase [Sphingomonas echinoides]|uniref:GNAT family N-acetyltransferase n=1 Tax=Sphingomonas echinoides TaxID=59803 RepID=UPI002413607A|nr:GNAT family N-acetyltransferase [Sphingomonas echinoides]
MFLDADDGFRALADAIDTPRMFLKACAPPTDVLAIVPPRWTLQSVAWMMLQVPQATDPAARLPNGYRLDLTTQDEVLYAVVLDAAGSPAASGYAASAGGVFCYDRIVTQPDHYRRGLGRVIMATLGQHQPAGTHRVLAATNAGRALYETLGWQVVAPYTTIEIAQP